MYQLARDTYTTLSTQLADQEYMFGAQPTTLDCIIFGYLSLHLYPDLAHGRLQYILTNEYPKLASYCDRIKALLYTEETDVTESEAAEDVPSLWKTFINNPTGFLGTVKDDVISYMGTTEEKGEKSKSQVDFERKRIWSIAGGVTFFLAYIIYNGIVSIDFSDENGEFYEQGEEEEYYLGENED
jgi:hypothetical protein